MLKLYLAPVPEVFPAYACWFPKLSACRGWVRAGKSQAGLRTRRAMRDFASSSNGFAFYRSSQFSTSALV